MQDPVQPPVAFEAIAANIVWQCYLAMDTWQMFCLAQKQLCNLLILKMEVVELTDTPSATALSRLHWLIPSDSAFLCDSKALVAAVLKRRAQ